MAGADIGVKMGVTGISQFKSAMTDAQSSIKTLDAALKYNEKQLKAGANAEKTLEASTTLLNAKMKEQKKIVDNATAALKKMDQDGVEPTSKAYQDMQRRLIEAQSAMLDTQEAMDTLGQTAAGTAEQAGKLEQSLGGLNKKVSLQQVISGVGAITSGLENAAKKAEDLGKKIWDELMNSARWADDAQTMALMYGVDLDTFLRIQKLVQNGMDTSVEAILKSKSKLTKSVGNGSDSFMSTLKELGLVTTEYGGKVAEGIDRLITDDSVDLFWKAGQAIMNLGDEYEQEAKAQELFGRSWRELIPLFTQFKSQKEFDKALEDVTVNTEEEVSALAELNDKVGELKGNFETLENKVLAGLAPSLTKASEVLSGLLENLIAYLETPEGQQALDNMARAVEGLFEDLGKIDPEQVVQGFADVFNGIVGGLQWMAENKSTLEGILGAIVTAWGLVKVTGGALEVMNLINGIRGLGGAGAVSEASAAGAAMGKAWGSGFAGAVMAAAPWLIGMYTLLNPAGTDSDSYFDPNTGTLTMLGWQNYRNTEDWSNTLEEVGEIFGDMARISADENAVNVMARYRFGSTDLETMIEQLEALGYVRRPTEAEISGDSGVPEVAYTQEGPNGAVYEYDDDGNKIGTVLPKSTAPYTVNPRTGEHLYQFPESEEAVALTEEQAEAIERFWDVIRQSNDGEGFTDADWEAYEGAFQGQEELFDAVDRLLTDVYQLSDDVTSLPEDLFPVEVEPVAVENAAEMLAAQIGTVNVPAHVYDEADGSNANGLWSVPFDGYRAILHKGERVVPAREAAASRNFSSNLYVENMNMNGGVDAAGLAAAIASRNRRVMAGFGS